MSLITDQHRFELHRAGLTDRQINTMAQKFYNLRNISPYTTEEYELLTKVAKIARERDELLAALGSLFERKWNGVVGSGCAYQWSLVGDWRHRVARMTGETLASAIAKVLK